VLSRAPVAVQTEVVEEWLLVRVARGLDVPTLDGATVKVRRRLEQSPSRLHNVSTTRVDRW
jgi:hypothetical protein